VIAIGAFLADSRQPEEQYCGVTLGDASGATLASTIPEGPLIGVKGSGLPHVPHTG
jgi:hypothetical protein